MGGGDVMTKTEQQAYFQTRFAPDSRREVLWQTLYRYYFSRLIEPQHCVLELGAGYGHFINQVTARKRIDEFPSYLGPGVEFQVRDGADLSFLEPGSVDFAFASNLFEHISQDDLPEC